MVLRRATTVGAAAVLAKDGALDDMLKVLRTAGGAPFVVDQRLLSSVVTPPQQRGPQVSLTPRELEVLQMLGDHFTSPVFTAALELWVAARTDPALLAEVGPLELRVGREVHRLTVELLGADESQPGVRELVQATLDLVRGLGLANTISDDARRRGRILDQWARTLDAALKKAAA